LKYHSFVMQFDQIVPQKVRNVHRFAGEAGVPQGMGMCVSACDADEGFLGAGQMVWNKLGLDRGE
jgi:hypothetical protein